MDRPMSTEPTAEAGRAMQDLLAALVEAKQFLGFQYAYWCIRGPSLEANIVLAGMAQEELGHAFVMGGLLGDDPRQAVPDKDDVITWDNWSRDTPGRAAIAMIDDWPKMVVTCLARDAAATATLEVLQGAADSRITSRAKKMVQEERFHLMFAMETARSFTALSRETRQGLAEDYRRALAEADSALGPAKILSRLTALGALSAGAVEARARFLDGVTRRLNDSLS